ncbi:FtsX-like permease family protein [Brotonthovivens ammoniilytica]|uniref:FtsX-like permease family protein n=1 Tax=Brotonthovivens ammoniilytica TaxID=2981725 RepID=A0ABT2TK63_9FIRM|nr:FtsX-like permease family protein [Brotonthovivens ammoniilytica]MCU6762598.1 FtsX-like permease family protein [Brotonthovivens ammoniilytica]
MKKAYRKDIWRTVKNEKKRFLSILLITMLGVTTLTGVTAACADLRYSADRFYDTQNLYDISVVSTLGLTEDDVDVLSRMDGVKAAEGSYSETVDTQTDGLHRSAEVKVLSSQGMNEPYVLEGRLPVKKDEIAVTENYISETGKSVGDTVEFSQREVEDAQAEPVFEHLSYTITGVVIDAANVNSAEGSASFRASSSADYTFFVPAGAVSSEVYTAVYLTLSDTKDYQCYSEQYQNRVDEVVQKIETEIKSQREQARYDSVTGEANAKADDAQQEMDDEFSKAEKEIKEAWNEISDGRQALTHGQEQLLLQEEQAKEAFAKARRKLEDGLAEIRENETKLEQSEAELKQGESQLKSAELELETEQKSAAEQFEQAAGELLLQAEQTKQAYNTLSEQAGQAAGMLGPLWPKKEWQAYLTAVKTGDGEKEKEQFLESLQSKTDLMVYQLEEQIAGLNPEASDYQEQLEAFNAKKQELEKLPTSMDALVLGIGQLQMVSRQIEDGQKQLEKQQEAADAQFFEAWETIKEQKAELADGKAALKEGRRQLEEGKRQLKDGEDELKIQEEKAEDQIADGKKQLEDSEKELKDGEAELKEQEAEFYDKKQEAETEIAEARREIADIDMAQWYVQDRSSLSGYSNIQSDSGSIEALGTAFPVVFLIVAVLIGLTTITRMVEEERGLIGTYKALGFSSGEIRRKYIVYAVAACLLGGIIGDLCGFILLPKIIFIIFDTMYLLPEYFLRFHLFYGLGGLLLFLLGIAGAAVYACRMELKQMPAVLMRPKAPHAGSKVFLERMPFLWKRFSFLNKVTARNLFRYKKRLVMTVSGIMGCTALVICGFTIKDTVSDLLPKQYEQIYQYDLLAAAAADDNEKLLSYLDSEGEVEDYINVLTDSVKVKNQQGKEEKLQLIAVPKGESLDTYIRLESLAGEKLKLKDGEIYITQNASRVLDFDRSDTVYIQTSGLEQAGVQVTQIVQNYLGNTVYMTQKTYEDLFDEYKPNGVLAHFSEACKDQTAYTENLSRLDGIVSAVSTEEMKTDFSAAFYLVNMVVYVILILAAGLAFVVLFTLSTTNISERIRELATIKVLGFYDREVHSYVNKETLILTAMGICLGLPLGHVLGNVLAGVLNMPSIQFAASIHPVSYVIAAVVSFCFALIVDLVTNRILDRINMVEALKSIE